MGKTTVSLTIHAPASQVWERISDYNGMANWHPAVEGSSMEGEGVGAVRTLTITGMGKAIERLDRQDDAARSLDYSASELPLPIRDYKGTMSVKADGETSCNVTWEGSFVADGAPEADLEEGLHGFYSAGLKGLSAEFK